MTTASPLVVKLPSRTFSGTLCATLNVVNCRVPLLNPRSAPAREDASETAPLRTRARCPPALTSPGPESTRRLATSACQGRRCSRQQFLQIIGGDARGWVGGGRAVVGLRADIAQGTPTAISTAALAADTAPTTTSRTRRRRATCSTTTSRSWRSIGGAARGPTRALRGAGRQSTWIRPPLRAARRASRGGGAGEQTRWTLSPRCRSSLWTGRSST